MDPAWFLRPDGHDASRTIHGVRHTLRVWVHAMELASALGFENWQREALHHAAIWHDIGRTHDGADYYHGAKSAGRVVGMGLHLDPCGRPVRARDRPVRRHTPLRFRAPRGAGGRLATRDDGRSGMCSACSRMPMHSTASAWVVGTLTRRNSASTLRTHASIGRGRCGKRAGDRGWRLTACFAHGMSLQLCSQPRDSAFAVSRSPCGECEYTMRAPSSARAATDVIRPLSGPVLIAAVLFACLIVGLFSVDRPRCASRTGDRWTDRRAVRISSSRVPRLSELAASRHGHRVPCLRRLLGHADQHGHHADAHGVRAARHPVSPLRRCGRWRQEKRRRRATH